MTEEGDLDPVAFMQKRPEFSMLPLAFLILPLFMASEGLCKTDRPVPRFVSTRSSETNLRVGPGANSPVDWIFLNENTPVEITAEFDTWRRVRDFEGTEGWFHQSMLKSQRFGIVSQPIVTLRRSDSPSSRGVVKLTQSVSVRIKKCRNDWCLITHDKYEGWLPQSELWGVYKNEKVG